MSNIDVDCPTWPPLTRQRSGSATSTVMTAVLGETVQASNVADDSHASGQTGKVAGPTDDDTKTTSTARPSSSASHRYTLADYFAVDAGSRDTFSCPRTDTQCDGFTFGSARECAEHERDWHAGPYACLARRAALASAEARRARCKVVKVYHGNDLATRRAGRLARLVRLDAEQQRKKRGEKRKRNDGNMMEEEEEEEKKLRTGRKRDAGDSGGGGRPLREVVRGAVIGTTGGGQVARGRRDDDGGEMQACEEPCCPFFERRFVNNAAYSQHVAGHGHVVAARMGGALLEQLNIAAPSPPGSSSSSTDVEMSGCRADRQRRQSTPSPQTLDVADSQLLTPPPTPHDSTTTTNKDDDDGARAWDATESVPMRLELRLARTQQTLRELRCNVPGCALHGRQLATSQTYWAHLASPSHVAALEAWTARGGEAVYVPCMVVFGILERG
ncbi:hypothetical protein V2A60_000749 [Cordyceps javanica]